MKHKKTHKRNTVLVVLFFVILSLSMIKVNYSLQEVENIKSEIITVCDTYFEENQCSKTFNSKPKIELINNTLIIRTITDGCTDFRVNSIKKIDKNIIVNLIEPGIKECLSGKDLQRVEIKLDQKIKLENLEVYQIIERHNKKEKLYPVENLKNK